MILLLFLTAACTTNAPVRPWAAPTAQGPEAEIYRTWVKYLDAKNGRFSVSPGERSPYWLDSEMERWSAYDLAGLYIPDGARPEVLSIAPDTALPGEYRIVTAFHAPEENNSLRARDARMTVFALPSDSGWKFGNALPRLTRDWRRDTVGPITYVIQPGYPYDHARGELAATFVDSLSRSLGVPRPDHLTYYLDSTEDVILRTLGLETDHTFGPVGGLAQPANQLLFSGIPSLGENYRHELTHIVVLPLVLGLPTTYFISDGVPTWLGGTTGMDFPTAARGLADSLTRHPEITLDSLLARRGPVAEFYPAGAVFVQLAYDHGGTAAVKSLFDAGPTDAAFRIAAERLFGRPWPKIAADWHARVLSFR